MVTFRVRNKNVYVERDGVEEFKKNLKLSIEVG